jgi:hypothetical protein
MSLTPKILDKLIDIERYKLDLIIKKRIEQEDLVVTVQKLITDLMNEIECEKNCALNKPDLAFSFSNYYNCAKNKWNNLVYTLAEEQIKLDDIVVELQNIYSQIKQYEHLKSQKEKEILQSQQAMENKTLDELNIIKKQGNDASVAN